MSLERYEITRSQLLVLRHHPDPAPGGMLLVSLCHCGGLLDLKPPDASMLVPKIIISFDRSCVIAFGEGTWHFRVHLIPRSVNRTDTSAWAIADYYRLVASAYLNLWITKKFLGCDQF